jgi:hypothetical protein
MRPIPAICQPHKCLRQLASHRLLFTGSAWTTSVSSVPKTDKHVTCRKRWICKDLIQEQRSVHAAAHHNFDPRPSQWRSASCIPGLPPLSRPSGGTCLRIPSSVRLVHVGGNPADKEKSRRAGILTPETGEFTTLSLRVIFCGV